MLSGELWTYPAPRIVTFGILSNNQVESRKMLTMRSRDCESKRIGDLSLLNCRLGLRNSKHRKKHLEGTDEAPRPVEPLTITTFQLQPVRERGYGDSVRLLSGNGKYCNRPQSAPLTPARPKVLAEKSPPQRASLWHPDTIQVYVDLVHFPVVKSCYCASYRIVNGTFIVWESSSTRYICLLPVNF